MPAAVITFCSEELTSVLLDNAIYAIAPTKKKTENKFKKNLTTLHFLS